MPDIVEKLKEKDAMEQTSEQEPINEDKDESESVSQPVQTGNVSDSDRSNLLEDPRGSVDKSSIGSVSDLIKKFQAPAKPFEKPQAPPPSRTKVLGMAREYEEKIKNKAAGTQSPGTKASGSQSSENASAAPASTPSPDKYELLKKDPNTLDESEKAERARLLIEKYVTEWKTKKDQQMQDLGEDLGNNQNSGGSAAGSQKSKAEKFFQGVDEFKEWFDLGLDIAGDVSSFATDVADTAYTKKGIDDHGPTSMASNIIGIGTSSLGTLSSTYGLFRSGWKATQKAKKGDKRGASLATFDAFSSLFGALSGGTNVASGITGLAGADTASNWLGHTANILGMAGSLTDTFKGVHQFRTYRDLANRKETEGSKAKMAHQFMRSREEYKRMKEKYKQGGKDALTSDEKMEMLKQRNQRKRSKDFMDAMKAAQEHAKIKSQAGKSGILSGALNTVSGAMATAGGFAKQFGGLGGKIAGTVLGGLGSLTKYATKFFVDKKAGDKEEAAKKAANDKMGKEYIEEKAAKLVKKPEPQKDHMTLDEAKTIISKRLGVDDPTNYAEIYKKLAERRAERILKREEGYQEVLAALGLTEDADKATILEALGVS